MNIGRILKFIINHTDDGIKIVESIKGMKGGDKKVAVLQIVESAIEMSDFTNEEQLLAMLPQCRSAWDAVLETRVAAMKSERALRQVFESAKSLGKAPQ